VTIGQTSWIHKPKTKALNPELSILCKSYVTELSILINSCGTRASTVHVNLNSLSLALVLKGLDVVNGRVFFILFPRLYPSKK